MKELLLLLALLDSSFAQNSTEPFPCIRFSGSLCKAGENLWYYGGQSTLNSAQTSNTWNNFLLRIDIGTSWPIGSPLISLVSQTGSSTGSSDSFPPAVSLGALWPNLEGTKLIQTGGELSDNPVALVPALQNWIFDIATSSWTASAVPPSIQRVAEGASAVGLNVNGTENVGYYFSGHLDTHTVQNWSNQIDRVYLSSLLTYDIASSTFNNISSYSSQIPVTFRADGTLTYIPSTGKPGLGEKGLLVAIGGATQSQYIDNTILDVFDIGTGGWRKQATSGFSMGTRVNHCAVRASSTVLGVVSHSIFIYGGQQLIQGASRDSSMFILTLPEFSWTAVPILPSTPTGRAGHQCSLVGSQMVVVGGLVSENLVCDQPGIYVFDVSKLAWQTSFTAGTTYTVPLLISNSTMSNSSPLPSSSSSPNTNSLSTTNTGAIAGGVIGGLIFLALFLFLLILWRRRAKKRAESSKLRSPEIFGSELDDVDLGFRESSEILTNKRLSVISGAYGHERNSSYFGPLDDVEEMTRNMDIAAGPHLMPKQALRVTNPEFDY